MKDNFLNIYYLFVRLKEIYPDKAWSIELDDDEITLSEWDYEDDVNRNEVRQINIRMVDDVDSVISRVLEDELTGSIRTELV